MKSFKNFSKDRSGHFSWEDGDLELVHDPYKKDRSDHFTWNKGDLEPVKDKLKEEFQLDLPLKGGKGKAPVSKHDFDNPIGHEHYSEKELAQHLPDHELSNEHQLHFHEHEKSLSRETQRQVKQYKSSSEGLNGTLRRNKGNIPFGHDYVKELDHHMSQATSLTTKEDMHVWRNFGKGKSVKRMKPGQVFQDKGYTGTSLKRDVATSFYSPSDKTPGEYHYTKIHVPAGTKGHYIDNTLSQSHIKREHEFVLHKGTKFKVMHHERHVIPDGHYAGDAIHHIVHLKVVGQDK